MPEPKGIGKLVGEVVPGVYRFTMHDDRIDFESDSYVVVEKDRAIQRANWGQTELSRVVRTLQ